MQITPSFNKLLTNGHAKSTTLGFCPKVVLLCCVDYAVLFLIKMNTKPLKPISKG